MNFQTTECPICMDEFNGTKNIVVTECGHTFHTNCLMKSVAHNGFGCPYCRTKMAEEIEDNPEYEDDEYDDDDDYDDADEYDDDDYDYQEEERIRINANETRIVAGLRWLFNRVNNEETIVYEEEDDSIDHEIIRARRQRRVMIRPETPEMPPPSPKPSVEYLSKKLVEQGVTIEDVLKSVLFQHADYESMEYELSIADDELFRKLNILIRNYEP